MPLGACLIIVNNLMFYGRPSDHVPDYLNLTEYLIIQLNESSNIHHQVHLFP